MKVLEAAENYLEAILVLKKEKGEVRSIDVVNHLGVSKPSVSAAIKSLRENGFVAVNEDGFISLSKKGLEIATSVYERHSLLTDFLSAIGVSSATVADEACKIEHHLSDESFNRLKEHFFRVFGKEN